MSALAPILNFADLLGIAAALVYAGTLLGIGISNRGKCYRCGFSDGYNKRIDDEARIRRIGAKPPSAIPDQSAASQTSQQPPTRLSNHDDLPTC